MVTFRALARRRMVSTEPDLRRASISAICTRLTLEAVARAAWVSWRYFAIDAQGAFAGQHAVNQGGWNEFFLARGYAGFDPLGDSNIGKVFGSFEQAVAFCAGDGRGFGHGWGRWV